MYRVKIQFFFLVHLGVRLTINIQSGELSLVDIVNSGVYDFKVAATNTNDGSQGYASVRNFKFCDFTGNIEQYFYFTLNRSH